MARHTETSFSDVCGVDSGAAQAWQGMRSADDIRSAWQRQKQALQESLQRHLESQDDLIDGLLSWRWGSNDFASGTDQNVPSKTEMSCSGVDCPSPAGGLSLLFPAEEAGSGQESPGHRFPADTPTSSAHVVSGDVSEDEVGPAVCPTPVGGMFLLLPDGGKDQEDIDGSQPLAVPTASRPSTIRTFSFEERTRTGGLSEIARRARNQRYLKRFLQDHSDTREISLSGMLPAMIIKWYSAWINLEEPPRVGCLHTFVYHKLFQIFITLTILANTIYTTWLANDEMEVTGDLVRPSERTAIDLLFITIFTVEMLLKFGVHRWYLFVNEDMAWNCFDTALVLIAIGDFVVSDSSLVRVTFTRSLRILKVGQILRVFRTMRFLKDLRVMAISLLGSLASLGWSIAMLGLIIFIFALYFVQQMGGHFYWLQFEADSAALSLVPVQSAMVTLAMSTTAGKDWEDVWTLIEPLGSASRLAFLFYVAFFTFAVMNVVTGLFVERALQLCRPSEREALERRKAEAELEEAELTVILEMLDEDGDGFISKEEFTQLIRNERVSHVLHKMGVDIKDATVFFKTVARLSQQSDIRIPDFVAHIMRLRGNALSMDLHAVILHIKQLERNMSTLLEKISEVRPHVAMDPIADPLKVEAVGRPSPEAVAVDGRHCTL